jgi:hypothetical protein
MPNYTAMVNKSILEPKEKKGSSCQSIMQKRKALFRMQGNFR